MAMTPQRRARLSIDVPREARRRIHIAAAKRDQSIRDYVWEAVEARLTHDLADDRQEDESWNGFLRPLERLPINR